MPKTTTRKALVQPLWRGPTIDGVTQSLLAKWIGCNERFRLLVAYGLRPAPAFSHRIEYGNFWHLYEQHDNEKLVTDYARSLCQKYPTQQQQIDHWYSVCKVQWPIYKQRWKDHRFARNSEPLFTEEKFSVPYMLPSGRTVRLRGKWDGVYLVKQGKHQHPYLYEHKCKGDPYEDQIKRQMHFDMQTMFYLVALREYIDDAKAGDRLFAKDYGQPAGVLYNVVRRPLSGGKGSIRQHKPTKKNPQGESKKDFYDRLAELISAEPEHYFMRWQVEVTSGDIARFEQRFLVPALEQLCDWWHFMQVCNFDPWNPPIKQSQHLQHPYGLYNVLDEGGASEMDEYLATGSKLGLEHTHTLFPELE